MERERMPNAYKDHGCRLFTAKICQTETKNGQKKKKDRFSRNIILTG